MQRQSKGFALGRRYVICRVWKSPRDHFLAADWGEFGGVAGGTGSINKRETTSLPCKKERSMSGS